MWKTEYELEQNLEITYRSLKTNVNKILVEIRIKIIGEIIRSIQYYGWKSRSFKIVQGTKCTNLKLAVDKEEDVGYGKQLGKNRGASLVPQTVKESPAIQQIRVCALSWEVPLEKEMAIHSSILAWRIPWKKQPWEATVHEITNSWTWLTN